MSSFNRVILMGNFTRDLELRYTPANTPVCEVGLAINERYKDREETVFVEVTLWGKTAETCSRLLGKGSQALIEGRLKFDSWETDGQKRSKLSVTADRVQFLGAPRDQAQQQPQKDDGFPTFKA